MFDEQFGYGSGEDYSTAFYSVPNPEAQLRLEQQGRSAATMVNRKFAPVLPPPRAMAPIASLQDRNERILTGADCPCRTWGPTCGQGKCGTRTCVGNPASCSGYCGCEKRASVAETRVGLQPWGFREGFMSGLDDLTLLWLFIAAVVIFVCVVYRQVVRLQEVVDDLKFASRR